MSIAINSMQLLVTFLYTLAYCYHPEAKKKNITISALYIYIYINHFNNRKKKVY